MLCIQQITVNKVVAWSTVQIERIVSRLRAAGETIADEDLAGSHL